MSDRDTAPDPMDKAYAQAEVLLDDDTARAARRARVLAAVAEAAAKPQPAPAPRRSIWRYGGWLAAASVAGVSVFIATQINQPDAFDRPIAPPTPQAPSVAPATPATPAPPTAAQPATAPPVAAPPAVAPSTPMPEPATQDVGAPPPPPPPPPPLPERRIAPDPPAPSSMERRIAPAAPAPPPARAEAPVTARSRVEEVVVTGSRIEEGPGRLAAFSSGSPGELGERLRAAADAGRASELARLLSRGAPIDAADDDGETALMKAIQARRLDAVALLRRRGANLDLKNHAGRSARDMAAALADPELDKALGLEG